MTDTSKLYSLLKAASVDLANGPTETAALPAARPRLVVEVAALPTAVWVLVRHNIEYHETGIVAVAANLEAAQSSATADLDPGWPALEWVQQSDGSWTTYPVRDLRYTADLHEVTA